MNNLRLTIACIIWTCWGVVVVPSAVGNQERQVERQKLELSLPSGGQLGALFDAGLRPYHFPKLENSVLGFKHIEVTFILEGGQQLPTFFSEWGQLHIRKGHKVSTIELRNPGVTLTEARSLVTRWLMYATSPPRTVKDLDDFLAAVKANPNSYNLGPNALDHDFALQWKDTNNLLYGVWLHNCRNEEKPLAVYMAVSFPLTPDEASSFYESPIPPPAGYETVSMSPPKDFGPDTPPDSEEAMRVMREGVMPDYTELAEAGRDTSNRLINQPITVPSSMGESSPPPPATVTLERTPWNWIALGLIIAITFAWLIFKGRKLFDA